MNNNESSYLAYLANNALKALYQQLALNSADNLSNFDKAVVLKAIVNHLLKDINNLTEKVFEDKDSSPRA